MDTEKIAQLEERERTEMESARLVLEAEVRALRDAVYGKPSTDGNWNACSGAWMRTENIAWLIRQVEKERATA
jgi:hypothetical protein